MLAQVFPPGDGPEGWVPIGVVGGPKARVRALAFQSAAEGGGPAESIVVGGQFTALDNYGEAAKVGRIGVASGVVQ